MAYFRCGGAGIPSSLKSGMNDVLNKKFGTSTTYPPGEWPDDVNLLGPLPEKTVSGSIASFTDGADDVPLKSLIFGAEPIQASGTPSPSNPLPISGHTSLTGVHCGKNLLTPDSINQISLYKNLANNYYYTDKIVLGANTQYTISPTSTASLGVSDYYVLYINPDSSDPEYLVITNPSIKYVVRAGTPQTVTFTTGATGVIRFGVIYSAGQPKQSALTAFMTIDYQIEVGNQATTYAPYSAESKKWEFQEAYTGSLNALTGAMESTSKKTMLNSLTWTAVDMGTYTLFVANLSDAVRSGVLELFGMCSTYKVMPDESTWTDKTCQFQLGGIYDNSKVIIRDDDYSSYTGAEFKEAVQGYIIYELATPTEISLDSVNWQTKLGDNNFYNDCGNTSVTYRQDISLALAALQGNRGVSLMMSRPDPEEPEEQDEPDEPEER